MNQQIWLKIKQLLIRTDGPTTVEYALLLALIVGMMVVSITYFGEEVHSMSDHIQTTLTKAFTSHK